VSIGKNGYYGNPYFKLSEFCNEIGGNAASMMLSNLAI